MLLSVLLALTVIMVTARAAGPLVPGMAGAGDSGRGPARRGGAAPTGTADH